MFRIYGLNDLLLDDDFSWFDFFHINNFFPFHLILDFYLRLFSQIFIVINIQIWLQNIYFARPINIFKS